MTFIELDDDDHKTLFRNYISAFKAFKDFDIAKDVMDLLNKKKNKIEKEKSLEPIVFVKTEFQRGCDNILNIIKKCIRDQGIPDEEKHQLGIQREGEREKGVSSIRKLLCKSIESKEYAANRQLLLGEKPLDAYTRIKSCSDAGAGSFLTDTELWFLVFILKLNIINLKPNSGGYNVEKHIYSADKPVSFILSDGFGSFDYLALAKGSSFEESKLSLGILLNGVEKGNNVLYGRDVKGDNPIEFIYTPDPDKKVCVKFEEVIDSPKLDSKPKVNLTMKKKLACMKYMQGHCQDGETCQYSHKLKVIRKFLDDCNARFPDSVNTFVGLGP